MNLTTQQRDALKKSITHWRDIVAGKAVSKNGVDCELCRQFFEPEIPWDGDCASCPVKLKTGAPHCRNTPFYKFRDYTYSFDFTLGAHSKVFDELSRELAQAELNFLIGILEESE